MNHQFDIYSMKCWLEGLEKPNEEEVVKALMSIPQERIKEILIKHIYEKRTFTALGKEYHLSRQRIHQLFNKGLKHIKKELGLIDD